LTNLLGWTEQNFEDWASDWIAMLMDLPEPSMLFHEDVLERIIWTLVSPENWKRLSRNRQYNEVYEALDQALWNQRTAPAFDASYDWNAARDRIKIVCFQYGLDLPWQRPPGRHPTRWPPPWRNAH
jgi:hypothetical protein